MLIIRRITAFLLLVTVLCFFTSAATPQKSGVPAEIYSNQLDDDLTKIYTSAISKANKSVLLMVYALTDTQIIECLKKKSLQGVSVKVICDAKASPYVDSKLGKSVNLTRRFGPGLMHQKILVIDNQKTWIGSANMTAESLSVQGNLVTKFEDKLLAESIRAKANTIGVEGRGPPFLHEDYTIAGQKVEMWFLPDNKDALLRLKTLIRNAKKNLRVVMYTWTREDLAKEVIDTAKRGVRTRVVIDNFSGKGVSAKVVKMLKDNGVEIALSPGGPLLHHKFMVIDGETLIHGSANWTKAAFTQNDDCFTVINNLSEAQRKKINTLWKSIWKESEKL